MKYIAPPNNEAPLFVQAAIAARFVSKAGWRYIEAEDYYAGREPNWSRHKELKRMDKLLAEIDLKYPRLKLYRPILMLTRRKLRRKR
jgi:hypothetical protein